MSRRVLFLCTGNSRRSQMAEALVNQFAEGWVAMSAGTRPSGYVHPLALRALAEIGIDERKLDRLNSKSVDAVREVEFDRVYTVCDSAAEDCPIWLSDGDVRHVPFFDPAKAEGDEAQQFAVFRRVRDEIRRQIVDQIDE